MYIYIYIYFSLSLSLYIYIYNNNTCLHTHVYTQVLPADIFPKTVKSLFARLRTDRIRHLFMALIRIMMRNEIDRSVEEQREMFMFDMETSRTMVLMGQLVEHGHFEKFHNQNFYDINKKDSLVSLFWEWTKSTYEKAVKADEGPPYILLAFKDSILRKFLQEHPDSKKDKEPDLQAIKVTRLAEHRGALRARFARSRVFSANIC